MANLITINQTLMNTIKQQKNDINKLKIFITKKPTPNPVKTSNNKSDKAIEKLIKMIQGSNSKKEFFYCWTHEFIINPKHTSCSYNHPEEGYVKETTGKDHRGCSIKHAKQLKVDL